MLKLESLRVSNSDALRMHMSELTKFGVIWSRGNSGRLESPSVQFISVTQSCPTLCNPMNCSTPGLPVHHQLPELIMSIESVMPSNYLILCHPLLLLPSILPSLRVFSSESVLHIRWPRY